MVDLRREVSLTIYKETLVNLNYRCTEHTPSFSQVGFKIKDKVAVYADGAHRDHIEGEAYGYTRKGEVKLTFWERRPYHIEVMIAVLPLNCIDSKMLVRGREYTNKEIFSS